MKLIWLSLGKSPKPGALPFYLSGQNFTKEILNWKIQNLFSMPTHPQHSPPLPLKPEA